MSEATEVPDGVVANVQSKPDSVIDQMLSTIQTGDAEDKHCLSYECDVILECKVCRNLFRVMKSFLQHKKFDCLQYHVSFKVPLPVIKTDNDIGQEENSRPETGEKTADPIPTKDTQEGATLFNKSPPKSKDEKSSSDDSQTKSSVTTRQDTAPVESNETMKLRSPRKKEITAQKKDTAAEKKDIAAEKKDIVNQKRNSTSQKKDSTPEKRESASHRRESTPQKRDGGVHKKDSVASQKRESSSEKKDSTPQKKDGSAHRRDSTPQKRESSSHRRESSTSKRDSNTSRRDSSKRDSSSEKRESAAHKKDSSSVKRETYRRDKRNSTSEKLDSTSSHKRDSSVEKRESTTHKRQSSLERRDGAVLRKDTAAHRKDIALDKKDSTSQKKESTPKKKDTASGKKESTVEKMDISIEEKKLPVEKMDVSEKEDGTVKKKSSAKQKENSTVEKMDISTEKEDSMVQKKDIVPERGVSRTRRRDTAMEKKESLAQKKDIAAEEKNTTVQKKDITAQKKNIVSKKDATAQTKDVVSEKKDGTVQKKYVAIEKKDVATEKKDSTIQKKDSTAEKKDSTAEKKDSTAEKKDSTAEKKDSTAEKKDSTAEKRDSTAEKRDTIAEKKDTIAEKKDTIAEKKDTIAEKKDTIAEKKDTIAEKKDTIAEKKDTIAEKKDTIAEKKDTIAEKKDTIAEKKDTIAEKKDTIAEKKDTTAEKKDTTAEKKDTTAEKKDTIAEKKDTIAEKKDTIAEKKDTTAEKKDTIAEKKDTTAEKKDTTAEKKDTTAEKKDTIAEKKDTIAEKKDTIAEKKDTIAEKNDTIAEKNDTIAEKKETIAEKKETIAEKKETIAEKKETKAEKTDTIAEKDTTAEKKDTTAEKKDIAAEKKDTTAQKKDIAAEKKDAIAQKKSTSQKKDIAAEEKDTTAQKKDIANEKNDSTVQKKDIVTEKDGSLVKSKNIEECENQVTNIAVGPSKVSDKFTDNEAPPKVSVDAKNEQIESSVDKKTLSSKQPNLEETDAETSSEKPAEMPAAVPEKSQDVDNSSHKGDASDKLNPLIAGVLDAYQRFKEDKTQSQLKTDSSSDKANDSGANDVNVSWDFDGPCVEEAPNIDGTEKAPDIDGTEKAPDIDGTEKTPNIDGTEKAPNIDGTEKAEETPSPTDELPTAVTDSAEVSVKSKSSVELDLDNKDLNDPERYELRNRLRCPDCGLELTNMSKLAHHMSKHLADSKGHFVCPICQKETRLETFSELILHLRDPHFLKDKQLLPMWRNLMKNCWVDEKDISATFPVIEAVKRSERGEKAVPEKNYKCPFCKKKPKILRFFSGLIGHLRSSHGLKRHQIQKIQAKLRKSSVVTVLHKKEKTKKCMLFKCSFCFKTFTKKSTIKVHVKSCRKRTECSIKEAKNKKPRGRPKTFTQIVTFKPKPKKERKPKELSATPSVASVPVSSSEQPVSKPSFPLASPLRTPSAPSYSASSRDTRDPLCIDPNMIQPVKLETFWVSKTPGKPSECIKSTVTNLEKLRRTPSKIFKSSELAKIGNFQCYSCNRYYSFRQHFERHVQLCTHNRRIEEISDFEALRCLECNQSFSYLQHLKRHAAKHLGLDRFRCKLCNYSSYYWSDTKCHLATHKDIDFRSPEYYILNVTPTENPNIISEVSNNYNAQLRKLDLPRPMLKRRLEPPQSSSGIVKTLILTERDGMLKVVSDPNQIARMVNQQGSPPLKRLRIAADGNPSPAIIKALPEIQKVVMAPSLNTVKRESTLLAKNLPSPTLSDPTPSAEMFEPATDPDKQHPSWVRKPLKDPDAQPFKWDDDEDEDLAMAERMIVTESNNSTATNTSITLVMEDANKLLATDDLDKKTNIKSDRALLYAEEEQHNIAETASIGIGTTTTTSTSTSPLVAEKPVPDNFSEPPKLTKEIPMENVLSAAGICKEEDLQMPSISESDISAKHSLMSSDSVMTFMLDENNDLLLISPEAASNNSMNQIIASSKDFFRVSHPSSFLSSLSSTSTSTMSYSVPSLSAVTQSGLSPTKALNKPKSYWDMQHKNALRRLPTRGLVSTSNLAFPSASRRVNKTPDPTSSLADVGSTIVTATAVISDLAGSDDIITTNAVAAVDATTETTTTTSPSSSSTSLSSSSSSPSPKTEK